jgi:alpha-glucosidase
MLLLTLRGTPTLYYGDEIGMRQVAIAPDQVRDPFEKNVPGIGVGRDGCRTPMQWDAGVHGGFTTGEPWLPLANDYAHENVANLSADTRSVLSLYRALIELRKATPALVAGSCAPVAATGDLLAYRREYEGDVLLIVLNLGGDPISIGPGTMASPGEILLSTNLDRAGATASGDLDLRGNEGLIIRLR